MAISLILVVCCSWLSPIYANRVPYCRFYLNPHVRVTLSVFHRLGLLLFYRSFALRVVSIKSGPLGPTGLSSVEYKQPIDGAGLTFYQGV
jgi:hypothetical protein